MAGQNDNTVTCCFCGSMLGSEDSVELKLSSKKMDDEQQILFAHNICLVSRLHESIPIHPALEDVNDR